MAFVPDRDFVTLFLGVTNSIIQAVVINVGVVYYNVHISFTISTCYLKKNQVKTCYSLNVVLA